MEALQAPLHAHVRGLQDVLQDVLLTICRPLPALREPRLARAWAYRIATREAVRRARRDRRTMSDANDDALDAVAAPMPEPAFGPELVAALPDALAGLAAQRTRSGPLAR